VILTPAQYDAILSHIAELDSDIVLLKHERDDAVSELEAIKSKPKPKAKAAATGGAASVASTESKRSVRSADVETWTEDDCLSYFKAHKDELDGDWLEDEPAFKATKNRQIYYRWLKGLDYQDPETQKLSTPGATSKDKITELTVILHAACWKNGYRGLKDDADKRV
jgi:hypothetical protein